MDNRVLPNVKYVNVNHRDSWQGALSNYFWDFFTTHFFKNIVLSILTLGIYPSKKYKRAKRAIAQALAKRKLFFFQSLQAEIEQIRQDQIHSDPRQSLNAIFMKIQSKKVDQTEEALEYKAIFSMNELLLFITNPIVERKSVRFYRIHSCKDADYLRMWHQIKKQACVNQYRQIQNINFYNKTLKEEYHLNVEEIHDRLSRTSICRSNISQITKFRELAKAFQEIVVAYQDFEQIGNTNGELYHLMEILAKTSSQDIDILQTYLTSRYLPRDLPLENRRQFIQLANQQEVLYHMSQEEQFNLCALILSKYQWDFLLSMQQVSDVTLNLLDWAFEESCSAMKTELSFIEKIAAGVARKVKDDVENFPMINEKIMEDQRYRFMTVDFGKELNREWPFFALYEKDKLLYKCEKTNALTLEKLLEVYCEIEQFCPADELLFSLLQGAFSQLGREAFQAAIEEGVTKLLGTKSEYFLPIFLNSNITAVKKEDNDFEIQYCFEQFITRKGQVEHLFDKEKHMIITQPLHKSDKCWVSPEATVKIVTKKNGT